MLNGLKMIKDIPALAGESTLTGLEEITLDVVNMESGHNKLTAPERSGIHLGSKVRTRGTE